MRRGGRRKGREMGKGRDRGGGSGGRGRKGAGIGLPPLPCPLTLSCPPNAEFLDPPMTSRSYFRGAFDGVFLQ